MASAVAGDTLQFTSAQISSYAYPDGTNFKALTALQDVQQTESPSSTQVFNDNVVQVSVRFDNNGVNSAYLTQTIGLFAKIAGGEDPILFAVVTAITPDQMPVASSVSPTALIYNIQITIQSNANISVTVNPAGTATAEDVQYIKDNYIPTSAIENDLDLLDEDPDKVLGASVGKELKSQIDALNTEMPRIYQLDGAEIQSGVQIDTISAVRASLIIWGVQNGVSSPFGIIIGINPSTSPQIQFSNFGMDELTPTYSGNIVKLPVNEYSNVVIWADKEVSVSGY